MLLWGMYVLSVSLDCVGGVDGGWVGVFMVGCYEMYTHS